MKHARWNERHAYAGEAALTPPQIVRIVLAEAKRRGYRFYEAWWLAEAALPWHPGRSGGIPQNETVQTYLREWHAAITECRPWFKAYYENTPLPTPLDDMADYIEPSDDDIATLAAAFASLPEPERELVTAGEWAPEGLDLD